MKPAQLLAVVGKANSPNAGEAIIEVSIQALSICNVNGLESLLPRSRSLAINRTEILIAAVSDKAMPVTFGIAPGRSSASTSPTNATISATAKRGRNGSLPLIHPIEATISG